MIANDLLSVTVRSTRNRHTAGICGSDSKDIVTLMAVGNIFLRAKRAHHHTSQDVCDLCRLNWLGSGLLKIFDMFFHSIREKIAAKAPQLG